VLPNFKYVRPDDLGEAIRHARGSGAHLSAGATDLLGCLHDGVFNADLLVSLTALGDELRGIRRGTDGSLHLGALTTIGELAESPEVSRAFPGLAQAAGEVASPQLRAQGTLGGNLCQKPRCWYYRGEFDCLRKGGDHCFALEGQNQYHCIFGGGSCVIVHPSDVAPMLVALDARVAIEGPAGSRGLPVADLHVPATEDPQRETRLEPGEVITRVSIPAPAAGLRTRYRKVRARRSWDFALAGLALALVFDGETVTKARAVLSGAAPIPWRSKPVEDAITARRLDATTIARAADAAVEGAEPLEHNGYKIPLFRAVVREELEAIREG
jgi:xanthine dehydrogenase YagS FAD-binding subunit